MNDFICARYWYSKLIESFMFIIMLLAYIPSPFVLYIKLFIVVDNNLFCITVECRY